MRFTYDLMTKSSAGAVRLETTTNVHEITEQSVTGDRFVRIYDNFKPDIVHRTIRSIVELEEWLETLARVHAWKPEKNTVKDFGEAVMKSWDPFDEFKELSQTPIDSNLKTLAAQGKLSIDAIPMIAIYALGMAMDDGKRKYGKYNWRDSCVTTSVFIDAIERHIQLYKSGENFAPDSLVHHLAHVMAGAGILLDAELYGVLQDDRKSTPRPFDEIKAILKKG